MNETLSATIQTISDFIDLAFAGASLLGVLLGLVFFLLGIIILAATLFVSITGRRVTGKVVGAVKDIRIKEKNRNGKIETERKESLHAIYEYTRPDGTLHREKSSNGGNSILKYRTGQDVELITTPYGEYDDVYDANDRSPVIMGGIFILIGFGLMYWAASFYASLGISTLGLIAILTILMYKILTRNKTKSKSSSKHHKEFDPAEVRPVEEFT